MVSRRSAPSQALGEHPGAFVVQGVAPMTRTALCRVCLTFVTAHQSDILMALRDHAIEEIDTHRMAEVGAVDLDGAFLGIMVRNVPWTPDLISAPKPQR
jgi:hypothetical protein